QSVCCGTTLLSGLIDGAEDFVNQHEDDLNLNIKNDPQRKKWMIVWLALYDYFGTGKQNVYDRWMAQKNNGGTPTTCSGNKNIADFACNCVASYACEIAARYKALNTVCDNTCTAPVSGGTGPIGNTGVCVVDYTIGQLGCPYLYGGSGGDAGNQCTGTTYNRYGENDACDIGITGNSGENEGRVSSIPDAPDIAKNACVTGLCPGNRRSYFDCSGLIYAAYNACHPDLGIARTAPGQCDGATGDGDARYTHEQYPGGMGLENVLVAGDIIEVSGGTQPGTCSIDSCNCISNHVGIYAGNGQVIHAPATCGRVRVDTLEQFLQDHQPFTEACHYKATETAVVIGSS
ncbi:MAG: C40 family peptidase, partial [Thaumarchaeota archaeon]|nr:C40 family peptidase [Nitrososphaerota archaeon]